MAQAALLSLTLKEHNGRMVLYAEGEIDISTTPVFASALASLSAEPGDLTMDLAGVTFIDSSGLHALMEISGKLMPLQRKVVIQNPHSAVIHAIDIAGITSRFDIKT